MKFNFFKLMIIFSILFFILCKNMKYRHRHKHHSHTHSHSHSHSHAKSHHLQEIMHFYASNAENYVQFAHLAYCEKPVIQSLSCPFCQEFSQDYATFCIHTVEKENH